MMSHRQKGWVIIILIIVVTLLTAWGSLTHAEASEMDAWEFHFFGVNAKDFEDRKVLPIITGIVSSFAIHEIGHLTAAKLMGADPYFSWDERVAYAGDGYDEWSNDQKALFHGAGFLAQLVVGSTLTIIPSTRHSDFNLGFNTFSTITGLSYGITKGFNGAADENSDVNNLTKYGYDGQVVAFGTALLAGGMTYISLDKHKDTKPKLMHVTASNESFSAIWDRVHNKQGDIK